MFLNKSTACCFFVIDVNGTTIAILPVILEVAFILIKKKQLLVYFFSIYVLLKTGFIKLEITYK